MTWREGMRGLRRAVSALGTILLVVLPVVGAMAVPHVQPLVYIGLVFVVAVALGHVGLTLRRGYVDPLAWLQDLGIAVLMAAGVVAAERLTGRVGGGPVDPSLLAVLGTYLLLAWPAWPAWRREQ